MANDKPLMKVRMQAVRTYSLPLEMANANGSSVNLGGVFRMIIVAYKVRKFISSLLLF